MKDLDPHLRVARLASKLHRLTRMAWKARRRALDDLSERHGQAVRRHLDRLRTRNEAAENALRGQWADWYRSLQTTVIGDLRQRLPQVDFHPTLDDRDNRLIDIWEHQAEDDRNRLQSARRAEVTAVAYYRYFGSTVTDVSIGQVSNPDGGDWRSHDLTVDHKPLDVKNTRRSPARERLGEFIWKQKQRGNGKAAEDVWIVGVVSDRDEPHCSTVLGEASIESFGDIREIAEDMFELFGIEIQGTQELTNRGRFWEKTPGWFFEYPNAHYGTDPWAWLPRCIEVATQFESPIQAWLVPLVASWRGTPLPLTDGSAPALLRALCRIRGRSGLVSLRKVFLFAILYLLARPPFSDEAMAAFVGALFPLVVETDEHLAGGLRDDHEGQHHEGWSFPLGIYDPMQYVRKLVDALRVLLESRPYILERAEFFRLGASGILKAKQGDEWLTVLAYCGGCGAAPLVIGDSPTCPCRERRLVCHHCGHCRKNCLGLVCRENEARQIIMDLNDSMQTDWAGWLARGGSAPSSAKPWARVPVNPGWFWSRTDGGCWVQPPHKSRELPRRMDERVNRGNAPGNSALQ